MSYQIYPTGFRRPLGLDVKTETKVDTQLLEFNRKLAIHEYRIDAWPVRDELFRMVRRLFGNFGDWLMAQDKNTAISQTAYDLIGEVIDFIETGRRPVDLNSRIAIINMESADNIYGNVVADRRTTTLLSRLKFPPEEYLFRWVNQPDGVIDMLCTVNFIFGSELRS